MMNAKHLSHALWTVPFVLVGCASRQGLTQTYESHLQQAGFQEVALSDADIGELMNMVPELKLVPDIYKGKKAWVFFDPGQCRCFFVGNHNQASTMAPYYAEQVDG